MCGHPNHVGHLQLQLPSQAQQSLPLWLSQGTGIYDFDTTYTHFLSCPMASFVASSTTTTTTSSTTSACPGYCPGGKAMNGKNCKDYHMDACIYDGCIGG